MDEKVTVKTLLLIGCQALQDAFLN